MSGMHVGYDGDTRAFAQSKGMGLFTIAIDDRGVKGPYGAITMQGPADEEDLAWLSDMMQQFKDRRMSREAARKAAAGVRP
jgi:hypothetical protein